MQLLPSMPGFFEAGTLCGPAPVIRRPYRTVCTTLRGRLNACIDTLGTLHLHLQAPSPPPSRGRLISAWRSGPVRRCEAMIEALRRGLALLGGDASREEVLRVGQRIDTQLFERLTNFMLVSDGKYEALTNRVRFDDAAAHVRRVPPYGAWVVARVRTAPSPAVGAAWPRPATYELVRHHRAWELWKRLEAGRAANRQHAWVCSVDILHHEPQFAAELLLYAHLRRNHGTGATFEEAVGLIPPQRLEVLRSALN
ncbi:MAG: hypothetical protein DIU62_002455 [Pseudomonadota bacterium]|jgi:hypothetical protein